VREISTAAGPDDGAALGGGGQRVATDGLPSQPLTALTDSRQRSQPPGAGTERYRTRARESASVISRSHPGGYRQPAPATVR
jgi:hypothetical protein